jgi:uncharacterized repeat protein (TIGR03803 family)
MSRFMRRIDTVTFALACGVALTASAAPAQAVTYKVLYSFRGRHNGRGPIASLINFGGTLYGTTVYGGARNHGTVFQLTP